VVWKPDWLGGKAKQPIDLVNDLRWRHAQFKGLNDSVDTGTPSGRFFLVSVPRRIEVSRQFRPEVANPLFFVISADSIETKSLARRERSTNRFFHSRLNALALAGEADCWRGEGAIEETGRSGIGRGAIYRAAGARVGLIVLRRDRGNPLLPPC
jgi:hypothetical protein